MDTEDFLHPSPLDSKRFDIKVLRGTLPSSLRALQAVEEIENTSADLVILRTRAGDSAVTTLLQQRGSPVIHADTLVYYTLSLPEQTMPSAPESVRKASAADRIAISRIAQASFVGYRSHYNANPLLPQDSILSGYVEWAQSRLQSENQLHHTWVVMEGNEVAGFATCDVSPDGDVVEIILNAVHPQQQRRGLYGKLLRGLISNYAMDGLQQLKISTQVWNHTVQRQWSRSGLLIESSFDTYHIDRRLIRS